MIFNSLCAVAKNKIEEEKHTNIRIISDSKTSSNSSYEENFNVIGENKFNTISTITAKDIQLNSEGNFVVPIFYKGEFVNGLGEEFYRLFNGDFTSIQFNEIIIPEGFKAIFYAAFKDFNEKVGNYTIKLPSSIEYIFHDAFYSSKNEIDISNLNNCRYFGKESFRNCQNLKGGFDFKIGEDYYIGAYAFCSSNFSGLNGKITIPNTLKIIPRYCFAWNKGTLKEVVFHDNVESIENDAFYQSSIGEQQKLILPTNLKEVGSGAFTKTLYEDIVFNEVLEKIGDRAFCVESNWNFFKDKKEGVYKIPSRIKQLGSAWWMNYTLANSGLEYQYYQNANAFKDYENNCILDLTEANNLEDIGNGGFAGWHKIKGSLFPPNIKIIGEGAYNFGINLGLDRATDSIEITNYDKLPDSLQILGNNWYYGFEIPLVFKTVCGENSQIRQIGDRAFYNGSMKIYGNIKRTYNITITGENIVLPDSLINIGACAFRGQPNIKTVKVKGNNTPLYWNEVYRNGTPTGDSSMACLEFCECPSLESIDLRGKLMLSIPVGFCEDSINLTTFLYDCDTIVTIYESAFYGTNLHSFEFREGLKDIRLGAFANKEQSKNTTFMSQEVHFPSTLTQVRPMAFNWANLTGIYLNEGLKDIDYCAFQYCIKATNELVIPSTVEYIGSFAFNHNRNYSNLSITIPKSVRIIGEGGDPTHPGYLEYNWGSHNFYDCAIKNREFIVDSENKFFTSIDGVLFGTDSEGNAIRLISIPRMLRLKENSPVVNGRYTIPEGVIAMDGLSFNVASGITELVLPNSFVIKEKPPKVKMTRWYGATGMGDFSMETSSVNPEGNTLSVAIYVWHSLQNVIVKEDNPNYKSVNGLVYTKDGKSLWYLSEAKKGEVNIEEGTERIEHGAIYSMSKDYVKTTSLNIPASVSFINIDCLKMLNNIYMASACTVTIDSNNTHYTIEDNKIKAL